MHDVLMAILLWSHGFYNGATETRADERWDVVRTFNGNAKVDCEAAASWFRQNDSGPLQAIRRLRVEYVCLPDSVNPRATKNAK
ncbi:MAG TPA: hypothetical protein VEH80_00815 [Candidatus Bathyarchaeia archaeon]|nr:hypothetical protein [Candidatus Bathyarchaeia archaeon]